MIEQFIRNLMESEYCKNKKLQKGILMTSTALLATIIILPGLRENILAILQAIIVVGAPITMFGIYDGLFKDRSNDDCA